MSRFAHRDDAAWWPPRHPAVCILDSVGIVLLLALMSVYKPSLTTAILPCTLILQYGVSILHHTLPYREWRSKLDRGVISLVIGATYVPYWGNFLSVDEATTRLLYVALATLVGVALPLLNAYAWCVGLFWAIFACTGLFVSFDELQTWLPRGALYAFWAGTIFYGAQQLVFVCKYPDPMPELFGYREVQHTLLLCAALIGSFIALAYTQ